MGCSKGNFLECPRETAVEFGDRGGVSREHVGRSFPAEIKWRNDEFHVIQAASRDEDEQVLDRRIAQGETPSGSRAAMDHNVAAKR